MSIRLPLQLQLIIDKIQSYLNYESIGKKNTSFAQSGIGKIGTTGFLLGLICGLHLGYLLILLILYFFIIDNNNNNYNNNKYEWDNIIIILLQWCTYIIFLSSFHFLEFFITAYCQPLKVNYDSYIVNHSKDYTIAAIASWIEYWIETLLFGKYKRSYFIMLIGFIMLICGQCVRSIAMLSCGSNFSHTIMEEKDEEHKLVTNGIYSILRHPSYFGW
jgi:protein-S-isoprenylcysteine O-methyltransferase